MPDYAGGFVRKNTTEIEKIVFSDVLDSYSQNTDQFFELTLIPTLAKPVKGCSEVYKFELTLKDNTRHRKTEPQILQKDGDILPESRYCPFGYKIERIYVYGDAIAVFLNVFSKGFESPDMNYLVVTGKIAGR
jgi:predicted secreted protein